MRILPVILLLFIAITPASGAPKPAAPVPQTTDTATVLRQIQEEVHAVKVKTEKGWKSPELWIPSIGTLLVAIGGWVLAVFIQKRTATSQQQTANHAAGLASQQADHAADRAAQQLKEQIERDDHRPRQDAARIDRERLHDRLFQSLEWFSGNTQKRSIGVGIVQGNWDEVPELREVWTAILVNQAVHLLTQSEDRMSIVELDNLVRILRILGWRDIGEPPHTTVLTLQQRQRLQHALQRSENQQRPDFPDTSQTKGLAIGSGMLQALSDWLAHLADQAPA